MKKISILLIVICVFFVGKTELFSQETDVTWTQLVRASVSGTTLQKTGDGKGTALSADILYGFGPGGAKNNGYFRYVVDQAVEGKQIGFSINPSNHFKKSELKYSFFFNKIDRVRILEEGVIKATFNYVIGDEFKISREDENIIYKINNVTVRTVSVNPREDLVIEAMLIGSGSTFAGVKKNYSGLPFNILVDVDTDNLAIDLTASGGIAPYTYKWSTGDRTQDVTLAEPGVVAVEITDSYGNSIERVISVESKVAWTGFYRSAEVNETLIKTGNGQWGGAISTTPIAASGNGWVEYTLENMGAPRAFGFVPTTAQIQKPQDIKYGIYILDDFTVRIIENNVIMLKYNYSHGDIFKVERVGLNIFYTRNGMLMHTTTLTSSVQLYIAGSIKTGASLKKVRFGGDAPSYTSFTYDVANDFGTILVNGPSGTLPYTYFISTQPLPSLAVLWGEIRDSTLVDSLTFFRGKVNSSTYSFNEIPSGRYYVAIYNNNGVKLVHEEIVVTPTSQVVDNSYIDISAANEWSVSASSPTGQGQGTVLGMLPVNESGGYEFEVLSFDEFIIGFTVEGSAQGKNPADFLFALGFEDRSGTFHIYLNGVDSGKKFARLTDKIFIGKEGFDFVLKINGSEIFRAPIPFTESAYLKLDIAFNVGTIFKPLLYVSKFKYPKPVPKVARYPECGELDGDFELLWPKIPSFMSVTITSAVLVNNGTGPDFTLTPPDYSVNSIPIGTYTLTVQYTLTVTTIFGTTVTSNLFTTQIAIGYVVEWLIVDPLVTMVVPGTVNTIQPISWSGLSTGTAAATSSNKTIPTEHNWVQFESVLYGTYFPYLLAYPHNAESFSLRNDLASVAGVITQSVFTWAPPILTTGVFSTNFTSSPNAVFRIEEFNGAFSLYKNGGSSLATGTSSAPGPFYIEIGQYGSPKYVTTISSFCLLAEPLVYVTPKRNLEGGFYLVPIDDILHFEFFEEYTKFGDLNYSVKDYMGEAVSSLATTAEIFGDNRIDINVSSLIAGYYVLEITNDKNEKWYLRFKVQ